MQGGGGMSVTATTTSLNATATTIPVTSTAGFLGSSVVYIGDAMEENLDILAQLAGKLGLLNVPLFMFQEGGDPHVGQAFMEMCRLSGGAYSHFDSSSADQLRELLKAVAVYAAGGLKALKDFSKSSNRTVQLLEQQLHK